MTFREELKNDFMRKVIAGAITGTLYGLLFGIIDPNPGGKIISLKEYLWYFIVSTPVYLMYSFPVILVYGTITSCMSDFIAKFISKRTLERLEIVYSDIFHILFGLILLWYSLLASILFFIVDLFLKTKMKEYRSNQIIISLTIPVCVWLLLMSFIWIKG
jgi:hypothetical protein